MADTLEKIKEAGVVGAGGAGFPTHVKVNCKAEVVIANGAECEPLLNVDQYAMRDRSGGDSRRPRNGDADHGSRARGHLHEGALSRRGRRARSRHSGATKRVSLKLLKSTYPAGDEQVMVYEVTGKVVPTGGLPLDAGAVVLNVSTLINVQPRAIAGLPVTRQGRDRLRRGKHTRYVGGSGWNVRIRR